MPVAKNAGARDYIASGNDQPTAPQDGAVNGSETVPDRRKTPIVVRFDPTLLKRVNAAARRRGVSRSSWIQYVISKILDEGEI